jgi:hypothetical protein
MIHIAGRYIVTVASLEHYKLPCMDTPCVMLSKHQMMH